MGISYPVADSNTKIDDNTIIVNTLLPKSTWARNLIKSLGFKPIN